MRFWTSPRSSCRRCSHPPATNSTHPDPHTRPNYSVRDMRFYIVYALSLLATHAHAECTANASVCMDFANDCVAPWGLGTLFGETMTCSDGYTAVAQKDAAGRQGKYDCCTSDSVPSGTCLGTTVNKIDKAIIDGSCTNQNCEVVKSEICGSNCKGACPPRAPPLSLALFSPSPLTSSLGAHRRHEVAVRGRRQRLDRSLVYERFDLGRGGSGCNCRRPARDRRPQRHYVLLLLPWLPHPQVTRAEAPAAGPVWRCRRTSRDGDSDAGGDRSARYRSAR